jgi:DNA-directed RNA polymerase specialized sigma24 family protein
MGGPFSRDQILEWLDQLRAVRVKYEQDEREAVVAAREQGLSWESIGQALGRNRSSVWEKYHYEVD